MKIEVAAWVQPMLSRATSCWPVKTKTIAAAMKSASPGATDPIS